MQLPKIQVVRLQQLQGFLDHAQAAVARALLGLAGQECLRAAPLHHRADVLLAPAFRAAINRRRVDVVHAQIERSLHDRHGHGFVVRALQRGLSAEAEDADFVPGAPQVAYGHGLRGGRRRLARGGLAHQARGCRAAQFQKVPSTGAHVFLLTDKSTLRRAIDNNRAGYNTPASFRRGHSAALCDCSNPGYRRGDGGGSGNPSRSRQSCPGGTESCGA